MEKLVDYLRLDSVLGHLVFWQIHLDIISGCIRNIMQISPFMSAYSVVHVDRRELTSFPCAYAQGGRVIEQSASLDLRVYLMPLL